MLWGSTYRRHEEAKEENYIVLSLNISGDILRAPLNTVDEYLNYQKNVSCASYMLSRVSTLSSATFIAPLWLAFLSPRPFDAIVISTRFLLHSPRILQTNVHSDILRSYSPASGEPALPPDVGRYEMRETRSFSRARVAKCLVHARIRGT